jgi:hypothetical protein
MRHFGFITSRNFVRSNLFEARASRSHESAGLQHQLFRTRESGTIPIATRGAKMMAKVNAARAAIPRSSAP